MTEEEFEAQQTEGEGEDGHSRSHSKLISRRGYYHLEPLDRALIVHLKKKHPEFSNKLLAKMFGVTPSAVDRLVVRYQHMPPIKELLQALAPDAVKDMKRASTVAAERGDPMPAEKILIHAGELEPIAERSDRAFGPQIIVGILPGMPVAPEPPQKAPAAIEGAVIEPKEP